VLLPIILDFYCILEFCCLILRLYVQDVVVNNTEGEWFKTNIGLPQGAVIYPILFIIYVKDLFEKIVSQRCKFADDSIMWKSGKSICC
jgi:hypothetical protein